MSVTSEEFIELGPSTRRYTVGIINNLVSGTMPIWDVELIIKIHHDEPVEDIQVSQ